MAQVDVKPEFVFKISAQEFKAITNALRGKTKKEDVRTNQELAVKLLEQVENYHRQMLEVIGGSKRQTLEELEDELDGAAG